MGSYVPCMKNRRTEEPGLGGTIDRRWTKRPQEEQIHDGLPLALRGLIVTGGGGEQPAQACALRTLFRKES